MIRTKSCFLCLVLAMLCLSYICISPSKASYFGKTAYSKVLLSDKDQLISARIAADGQWRIPHVGNLSDKYKKAVLLFEDRNFSWHWGFDPIALARAAFLNLKHGTIVSGGSTITMQLARLARNNPPRTYWEKFREVLLAVDLEIKFSKDEILELYSNHVPVGGNHIGVTTGAFYYFGRPLDQLTWAESALLAVLPNSPGLLHLSKNRDILKAKRDRLLTRLQDEGYMSLQDLELSKLEPLPIRNFPISQGSHHLLNTLSAQNLKTNTFHSYINQPLQNRLYQISKSFSGVLSGNHINNLAILVLDQKRRVIGYIGNSPLDELKEGRFVDIVQRPRSTGSLLKPFLYGLMLDSSLITPMTLVQDIPRSFGRFRPENFDRSYRGAVPSQEALIKSLNIPFANMLKSYGIDRFHYFLKSSGITTLNQPASHYGLSLILGGAESTLFQLSDLYSRMAYQVSNQDKDTIPAISLHKGQTEKQSVGFKMSLGASFLTIQAMQEVVRPGVEAHWQKFLGGRNIAWKTGTSHGFRDAWAIGVSPEFTVGVWVGNADGTGRPELTGIKQAAPILFQALHSLPDQKSFDIPWFDLKTIAVCRENGYRASQGCEEADVEVPAKSRFQKTSPHHKLVQLDSSGQYQVHSQCESVYNMKQRLIFSLPPIEAHYFRRYHSWYKGTPPFRKDCNDSLSAVEVMSFIYPFPSSNIYVPNDFGGRSATVFKVAHKQSKQTLEWYLDREYLGKTKLFHEMAIDPKPGRHRITVVDLQGRRISRFFEILD
ncbi:penicillin-binding protein 1C [Pseudobacteriovorax antillogorgiicola]|nr:penicillin-binding protein 1C [Pseudobacteriovorax antillogorgiicola]